MSKIATMQKDITEVVDTEGAIFIRFDQRGKIGNLKKSRQALNHN